ncbi:MAG: hypothetical protein O7D91_21045, partial [Planctomycetota bacterium]|nr:hypothetical protein [Planctomycetota bacterium]
MLLELTAVSQNPIDHCAYIRTVVAHEDGAEVGLLLRRLRDRLGIPLNRFQIICATASFKDEEYAPDFGAQISGVAANTFVPITGSLDLRPHNTTGSVQDA